MQTEYYVVAIKRLETISASLFLPQEEALMQKALRIKNMIPNCITQYSIWNWGQSSLKLQTVLNIVTIKRLQKNYKIFFKHKSVFTTRRTIDTKGTKNKIMISNCIKLLSISTMLSSCSHLAPPNPTSSLLYCCRLSCIHPCFPPLWIPYCTAHAVALLCLLVKSNIQQFNYSFSQ